MDDMEVSDPQMRALLADAARYRALRESVALGREQFLGLTADELDAYCDGMLPR